MGDPLTLANRSRWLVKSKTSEKLKWLKSPVLPLSGHFVTIFSGGLLKSETGILFRDVCLGNEMGWNTLSIHWICDFLQRGTYIYG